MTPEGILFSQPAPWIFLALSMGALYLGLSKKVVRGDVQRKRLFAVGAVVFVALAFFARCGPLWLAAGEGDRTVALESADDAILVADMRNVSDMLPDPELQVNPIDEDVLRLHVLDPATGARRCRAVAGYQARLLGVADGVAWVGAAGFRADTAWSLATVRRMSLSDCTLEDVRGPGWTGRKELGGGTERIEVLEADRYLLLGKNGVAMVHEAGTGGFTKVDLELVDGERRRREEVKKSPFLSAGLPEAPLRTQGAKVGGPFFHVAVREANGAFRALTKRVYVNPVLLAHAPERKLTLMAARDTTDGPLVVLGMGNAGEIAFELGEELLFERTADVVDLRGAKPLALARDDGFVIAHALRVAMVGFDGKVRWRARL